MIISNYPGIIVESINVVTSSNDQFWLSWKNQLTSLLLPMIILEPDDIVTSCIKTLP